MLVLTLREFDIRDAYAEFDTLQANPKGWNFNGQRAFMMRGGGHLAENYPCKVKFARR